VITETLGIGIGTSDAVRSSGQHHGAYLRITVIIASLDTETKIEPSGVHVFWRERERRSQSAEVLPSQKKWCWGMGSQITLGRMGRREDKNDGLILC